MTQGVQRNGNYILDSRVSSSLEDKNPGEPPGVRPENDKEIIFGTDILRSTESINLDCRVSRPAMTAIKYGNGGHEVIH